MRKIICIILGLLFSILGLSAINNMPLMQTFVGHYMNSHFGKEITCLDLNADGFDDLVVRSDEYGYGRIEVYYGGAVLDTIPDLIRIGQYIGQLGRAPTAVGDINNDGYEDLLLQEVIDDTHAVLRFCYGGPNADLIPDYEYPIAINSGRTELFNFKKLGDVNNDGYDDMGCYWQAYNDATAIKIMLGGSFETYTVAPTQNHGNISGLGDVNGDGIDDFIVGHGQPSNLDDVPRYRYIYYGSNPFNINNRVLMLESYEVNQVFPGGYGLGDINGDGYNDMVIHNYPYINNQIYYFKLGSGSLPVSEELVVTPVDFMFLDFGAVAYGDFNGDGYSDVVSADFMYDLHEGAAGVWLGRANANGQCDLAIHSPNAPYNYQFGSSVITGDFNGDGYCDVAIASINWQSPTPEYAGKVFVYAGNAELEDTTVDNDDQVTSPLTSNIKLNIYPNPVYNKQSKLGFSIAGKNLKHPTELSIILYNVKGQAVSRHALSAEETKKSAGAFNIHSYKPGVYLAVLFSRGIRLSSCKFTIK